MTNNLFEFGDMYFLQLLGTAMGTSAACMWATIYFAVHESGTLLPQYHDNLLLFCRFIDDMIGIWIPSSNTTAWEDFKSTTNNFGILEWEFEDLTLSCDFLDLTITIEDGIITTKTYQKALNLYQYLMPSSNHNPRQIKGIIYSLVRNYKRQNTHYSDYKEMVTKLFDRHVARGWDRATMKQYILEADSKLSNLPRPTPPPTATTPLTNKERLFLHFVYHRCDIPKQQVRSIYNNTCGEVFENLLDIKQLTVAYSRSTNIRESVSKAKLHQAPGREASKFYTGELP